MILDNYRTHKKNDGWLVKYQGRVQFHFTPPSVRWLNQVEIWCSLLTRKALPGASFKSQGQSREAIEAFVQHHRQQAHPFRWRKREVKGTQLTNTGSSPKTVISLHLATEDERSSDRSQP